MPTIRIESDKDVVAILTEKEEAAVKKALKFALEVSFERLEVGIGIILEDDEQLLVTDIFTGLWPDEKGAF